MVAPSEMLEELKKRKVDFFTGVPDSLLSSFCAYVDDMCRPEQHLITANEGNAVAVAAGYHLSTGNIGVVYMQNSGLGNAINPLCSLADIDVYQIPMLLVIGWRGEPGVKDEPQHVMQGRVTPAQLELLGIYYRTLEEDSSVSEVLDDIFSRMLKTNSPAALLVRKGAFDKYASKRPSRPLSMMLREDALRKVFELKGPSDLIVSTTGKTSREVYEIRTERNEPSCDFLTVGGMGHASSIALGVALGAPEKKVICIDGDGALLMHLGAAAIIGANKPRNLLHIVINNSAHESVGGQPTVAGDMDLKNIVLACGYSAYFLVDDLLGLANCWKELNDLAGPVFLEVRVAVGSRDDLGRPSSSPKENKIAFMEVAFESGC